MKIFTCITIVKYPGKFEERTRCQTYNLSVIFRCKTMTSNWWSYCRKTTCSSVSLKGRLSYEVVLNTNALTTLICWCLPWRLNITWVIKKRRYDIVNGWQNGAFVSDCVYGYIYMILQLLLKRVLREVIFFQCCKIIVVGKFVLSTVVLIVFFIMKVYFCLLLTLHAYLISICF